MAEEKTEQEAPPAKGKGSKLKLIIVGVLALVLIGGAAAAVLMLRGGDEEAEAAEAEEAELAPAFGPIYPLEDITVNLNDASGQRWLRVEISLELNPDMVGQESDAATSEIEARLPLVRDALVLLLSGLRLEDINSVEGKEELKEAIRARLDQFLRPGLVRNVLFVEFLVQ